MPSYKALGSERYTESSNITSNRPASNYHMLLRQSQHITMSHPIGPEVDQADGVGLSVKRYVTT
jgi:hypothetical protein